MEEDIRALAPILVGVVTVTHTQEDMAVRGMTDIRETYTALEDMEHIAVEATADLVEEPSEETMEVTAMDYTTVEALADTVVGTEEATTVEPTAMEVVTGDTAVEEIMDHIAVELTMADTVLKGATEITVAE